MGGFENAAIIMGMLVGALAVACGVRYVVRLGEWLVAIVAQEREIDRAEAVDRRDA